MTRILGLSGSLRAGSFNTALLHAAQSRLPPGVTLEVATLHGIPLYDGDREASEGLPAAVTGLKEKIVASDGVLLATPSTTTASRRSRTPSTGCRGSERRGTYLPRPAVRRHRRLAGRLRHHPRAVAWLPVLPHPRRPVLERRAADGVAAQQVFDAEGAITDPKLGAQLEQFLAGFAAFATAERTVIERWHAIVARAITTPRRPAGRRRGVPVSRRAYAAGWQGDHEEVPSWPRSTCSTPAIPLRRRVVRRAAPRCSSSRRRSATCRSTAST